MPANNIDNFANYLKRTFSVHYRNLKELTIFVSSNQEQRRLNSCISKLESELNIAMNNYIARLEIEGSNYRELSEEFRIATSNIIENHALQFKVNSSYWFSVAPTIRSSLGVVSFVCILPAILAATCLDYGYYNTFFDNPYILYQEYFNQFVIDMNKTTLLDSTYQLTIDKADIPLLDIPESEWDYAKEILKNKGKLAADGTKLKRNDPQHINKIKHSFIVIDGSIFAMAPEGTYIARGHMDLPVKLAKDESSALWIIKKIPLLSENEPNISLDLGFSRRSTTRQSKQYLPLVYCAGETISDYIEHNPDLSLYTKIDLLVKAVSRLDELNRGLLSKSGTKYFHGDTHDGNFLVSKNELGELEVNLIDFGRSYRIMPQFSTSDEILNFIKLIVIPILNDSQPSVFSDEEWSNIQDNILYYLSADGVCEFLMGLQQELQARENSFASCQI
ncbi:MAG: hypothetical protein P1U74_11090 [Legionellaceae bacterium]|nr:hypothetical protein [Legionellaceae bacterium]